MKRHKIFAKPKKDEADELLQNETFRVQVGNIRDGLSYPRLQTLCLSATFPNTLAKFFKSFLRPNPFIIKARNGVQLTGIGVSSFRIPNIEKVLKKREVKLELAEKIITNVEFSQGGIYFVIHFSLDRVSVLSILIKIEKLEF